MERFMNKRYNEDTSQITNEEQRRFYELAQQARNKWDWDAAETYYKKAIEVAPKNAEMYLRRGAMRCVKYRLAENREVYLEGLKTVISDYRKAYELNPNDPIIALSLIETEIFTGSPEVAAIHSKELFQKTNEHPVALGLCSWLGAVACTLAGQDETEWRHFREHLPLARHYIEESHWDAGDIEKYLMVYAEQDVPPDNVKKALQMHRLVMKQANEPMTERQIIEKKHTLLWRLLSETATILDDGYAPIPLEKTKDIEEMLAGSDQSPKKNEDSSAELMTARGEFQKLMLRQGTILATKAETAAIQNQEERHQLYLESLEYLESAARISSHECEIKEAVISMFRQCAAFLAVEQRDARSAAAVIERLLSLYPEDENLRHLSESVKKLAG